MSDDFWAGFFSAVVVAFALFVIIFLARGPYRLLTYGEQTCVAELWVTDKTILRCYMTEAQ